MLIKGKIFLSVVILAGIIAALTPRPTLYSDVTSKYSSDSNTELQSTALGLVEKIRGRVDSYNKKDRELMAEYQTNHPASRTPAVSTFDGISDAAVWMIKKMHLESVPGMKYLMHKAYAIASWLAPRARDPIREEFEKNLTTAHDSAIRNYKEKLLAESKTIRAELQRRLPERMHRPQLSKTYENPSVALELEIIASDLDRLSRSLPGNWSIAELKKKATDLVVQLRSFIRTAQKERAELDLACMQKQSRANTEERQSPIRQRCNNDAIKLSENHVAIYNERFKGEAIFLRGESLFRLPKEYRSKIAPPVLFEFPQNLIGMEMIATSIELLGKSLPDR
jgi:hypothetical protein